ncbi:ankyrin-2-like [Euwallacea fornicatus]|uniref:ankyrin-2-like n=1 Tax=Euwallacea fornicatus TaxID=995702 RepID=UPI00338FC9E4
MSIFYSLLSLFFSAQPIDPELTAKLLGHGVAVSPVVTVEPRRRKFHKAIRLNMPAPTAHSQGMINQYSGSAPTLRLLCSITDLGDFARFETQYYWYSHGKILNDIRKCRSRPVCGRSQWEERDEVPRESVRAMRFEASAGLLAFSQLERKLINHVQVSKSNPLETNSFQEFPDNRGTTRAQWEDVTGSTPLTFVNDVVSFTTTVSARFWLMDCRNIGDATKMATELYKEAIHVPFMAKFVVFAKRIDPMEARLRVFCMTDDKEDKTLEHQEHFTEVAKSRDVEVLEGKCQFIEFAGNLVPITKSGEHLQFSFRAFRENRLPFSVRVKDQHAEAVGRCLFMREPKIPKGEQPQQPICILNIVLPDDIVTDTISLTDSESGKRHMYLSEFQDYYKPDPRLADMSNLLGEDWVELAHQLGLTSSEINVIKSEYPESIAKQAQSMLRMWLSQSGNKAQTNTLENALKRIGREDIIPQCLNVEQPSFARIKEEEIGYRLRRKEEEERRKIIDHYDKYSAEEKAVKSESEEEDNFDRTVTERREQIEKRLSAERAIPASAQRREIVQEISDIKRQSLVEDKIAEVMQKGDTDVKIPAQPQYISETIEIKTTLPSDSRVTGNLPPTVVETHKIVEETATQIRSGEDARFVEEVSSRFDGPRVKIEQRVSSTEDPRSPNFSKTPPPSPADFLLQKQAAAAQASSASPQDDDDSLDTDGFREDQFLLQSPGEESSPKTQSNFLDSEVTTYQDATRYYQHVREQRKRLASTEDLENVIDATSDLLPSNRDNAEIAKIGLDSFKKDVIRPDELLVKCFCSPEEKGAKDSKKPEDWERKERKTVERLHGGGGKDKLLPGEEHVYVKTTSDKVALKYQVDNASAAAKQIHKSTSPPSKNDLDPTPVTSPLVIDTDKPTLELIIGRKEVKTKDASATAESRLTLYGHKDVEISIKSQSHISVTTITRDNSGFETSEKFDVGINTTAETEGIHGLIIPVDTRNKREETVNFSGTKQVYTYDTTDDLSEMASPHTEEASVSHHVTDTGISLTRGTTTETLSIGKHLQLAQQTTGFISDTIEPEEGECTDAGLSPIQADETLHQGIDDLTLLTETATSPIDFHVDTSEAATLTDQVDTKDASNSPIKIEESPPLSSAAELLKDEEVLAKRRGSGDVKAKIKLIEEQASKHSLRAEFKKPRKELVDSEDELSSMKEEEVLRASTETLAQVEDDEFPPKEDSKTTPKHVGRKIAELQKVFSSDSDLSKAPIIETIEMKHSEQQYSQSAAKSAEDEDIEQYQSVKEKTHMFEDLISKSQEGTPLKKPSTKPFTEKEFSEQELRICLDSLELQILEEKDKEADIHKRCAEEKQKWEARDKSPTEPCREPPCIKIHVEPKVEIKENGQIHQKSLVSELKHRFEEQEMQEQQKSVTTEPCVEIPCRKTRVDLKLDSKENGQLPQKSIVSELKHLFEDQVKIVEGTTKQTLEVVEEPCTKCVIQSLEPTPEPEIKEEECPEIIKEALFSNAKLISTIALPLSPTRSLDPKILQSIPEEPISRKPSPQSLDIKSIPVTESEVQKIISEVLEASKQIRQDVKDLKPDLTPTPEGQLVQMVPSSSVEKIKELKRIEEEIKADIGFDEASCLKIKKELHNVKEAQQRNKELSLKESRIYREEKLTSTIIKMDKDEMLGDKLEILEGKLAEQVEKLKDAAKASDEDEISKYETVMHDYKIEEYKEVSKYHHFETEEVNEGVKSEVISKRSVDDEEKPLKVIKQTELPVTSEYKIYDKSLTVGEDQLICENKLEGFKQSPIPPDQFPGHDGTFSNYENTSTHNIKPSPITDKLNTYKQFSKSSQKQKREAILQPTSPIHDSNFPRSGKEHTIVEKGDTAKDVPKSPIKQKTEPITDIISPIYDKHYPIGDKEFLIHTKKTQIHDQQLSLIDKVELSKELFKSVCQEKLELITEHKSTIHDKKSPVVDKLDTSKELPKSPAIEKAEPLTEHKSPIQDKKSPELAKSPLTETPEPPTELKSPIHDKKSPVVDKLDTSEELAKSPLTETPEPLTELKSSIHEKKSLVVDKLDTSEELAKSPLTETPEPLTELKSPIHDKKSPVVDKLDTSKELPKSPAIEKAEPLTEHKSPIQDKKSPVVDKLGTPKELAKSPLTETPEPPTELKSPIHDKKSPVVDKLDTSEELAKSPLTETPEPLTELKSSIHEKKSLELAKSPLTETPEPPTELKSPIHDKKSPVVDKLDTSEELAKSPLTETPEPLTELKSSIHEKKSLVVDKLDTSEELAKSPLTETPEPLTELKSPIHDKKSPVVDKLDTSKELPKSPAIEKAEPLTEHKSPIQDKKSPVVDKLGTPKELAKSPLTETPEPPTELKSPIHDKKSPVVDKLDTSEELAKSPLTETPEPLTELKSSIHEKKSLGLTKSPLTETPEPLTELKSSIHDKKSPVVDKLGTSKGLTKSPLTETPEPLTELKSSIHDKKSPVVDKLGTSKGLTKSPLTETPEPLTELKSSIHDKKSPVVDKLDTSKELPKSPAIEKAEPLTELKSPIQDKKSPVVDKLDTSKELPKSPAIEKAEPLTELKSPIQDKKSPVVDKLETSKELPKSPAIEKAQPLTEHKSPIQDKKSPELPKSPAIAKAEPLTEHKSPIQDKKSPVVDKLDTSKELPKSPAIEKAEPLTELKSPIQDKKSPVVDKLDKSKDLPKLPAIEKAEPLTEHKSPIQDKKSPELPKSPAIAKAEPLTEHKSPIQDKKSPVVDKLDKSKELAKSPLTETPEPLTELKSLIHDKKSPVVDKLDKSEELAKSPLTETPEPLTELKSLIHDKKSPVVDKLEKSEELAKSPLTETPEPLTELKSSIHDKKPPVVDKLDKKSPVVDKLDTSKELPKSPAIEKAEPLTEHKSPIEDKKSPVVDKLDTSKELPKSPAIEKAEPLTELKSPIQDKKSPKSPVVDKLDTIKELAKSPLTETLEPLTEHKSPIHDKKSPVVDKLDTIKELAKSPLSETPEPLTELKSPIHDKKSPVDDKLDKSKELAKSPLSETPKPLTELKSPIHDKKSPLKSSIHDEKSPVVDKLDTSEVLAKSPLTETPKPLTELKSPIHDKKSPVVDKLDTIKELAKSHLTETLEPLTELKSPIHDKKSPVDDKLDKSKELAKSPLSETPKPLTELKSSIHDEKSPVVDKLDKSKELAKSPLSETPKPLTELKSPIHDKKSPVVDKLDTIKELAKSPLTETPEPLTELKSPIHDKKSPVDDKLDKSKELAKSPLSETPKPLTELKSPIHDKKSPKSPVDDKLDKSKELAKSPAIEKAEPLTELKSPIHDKKSPVVDKLDTSKELAKSPFTATPEPLTELKSSIHDKKSPELAKSPLTETPEPLTDLKSSIHDEKSPVVDKLDTSEVLAKSPLTETPKPLTELKSPIHDKKSPVVDKLDKSKELAKSSLTETPEPLTELKSSIHDEKSPVVDKLDTSEVLAKSPLTETPKPLTELKFPIHDKKSPVVDKLDTIKELAKSPLTETPEPLTELKSPIHDKKSPVDDKLDKSKELAKSPLSETPKPLTELKSPIHDKKSPTNLRSSLNHQLLRKPNR